MPRFLLTPVAEDDLRTIKDYIAAETRPVEVVSVLNAARDVEAVLRARSARGE